MKNLLIYLNPRQNFDKEHKKYAEIQIDNSLQYCHPKDLIMITNFPYKYHNIKAIEVPNNLFCEADEKASKVNAIIYAITNKLVDELTWFHDMDAWQISPIDLKVNKDLGLTDYGWKMKWNTGSFFFKPKTLDIFKLLKNEVYKQQANEEPILWELTKKNVDNINDRIERLNITYNLGKRRIKENLEKAEKPVKVAHFHPYREDLLNKFKLIIPNDLYQLMYDRK